ncbi:MAG: alanine racemase [Pedosphaera sp.]|nr:alanine racemase [Pedosphaera sp.]
MNPPSHLRPAWIEISRTRLRENWLRIAADKPAGVSVLNVIKANAYGHGAIEVARVALSSGADWLGVVTLDEALALRDAGIQAPILMIGERLPEELPWCANHRLTVATGEPDTARAWDQLGRERGTRLPLHLKVDTGMSRYGARWTAMEDLFSVAINAQGVVCDGLFTHFAQSDESDKTFARQQLARFQEVVTLAHRCGLAPRWLHTANSGGFLDLPETHFNLVRLGILPLGVYPSTVCRRISGIEPVMTVKARLSVVKTLESGDAVGYGMRWKAEGPRRVGIVPLGYGDGFPRIRNAGWVLVRGQQAPILGSVAMDAFAVDITPIADAARWDEVVVMGAQGSLEITAHDLARWKGSVSYDILTGWRSRLPRITV